MSLDGVIAGLRAACEGMDGIVAVDVGEPSPMPRTADQFPRIIIEVGTTAMTQTTFGKTDGWVELGHQGSIRLLLGTSDSRHQRGYQAHGAAGAAATAGLLYRPDLRRRSAATRR
jgi:hypothetical protein